MEIYERPFEILDNIFKTLRPIEDNITNLNGNGSMQPTVKIEIAASKMGTSDEKIG